MMGKKGKKLKVVSEIEEVSAMTLSWWIKLLIRPKQLDFTWLV